MSFDTPAGSKQVTADHVLLTLPFAVLRTVDYRRANFEPLRVGQYVGFSGWEKLRQGKRSLRRRASLERLPGLHGGRRVDGRGGGERDPR
jgi:hypothetical protein